MLAYGKSASDGFGRTVRTGDVNGDGIADLIAGAAGADVGVPVRMDAGAVLVWFGDAELEGVKDAASAAGTAPDLTIWGATAADQLTSGGSLVVADVNGDGIADLIIGAPLGDGPGNARSNAGEAYIVFGRPTFPATLDLAIEGAGGADVTIFGATANDNLASAGAIKAADVNGDGIDDLLLGAPLADGPEETWTSAGEAYIVFGRGTFPATLDLGEQGSAGADVTIYGAAANDFLTFGGSMAASDVNGDGICDVLLGAIGADGPAEARSSAGEAFIVFGRATFPTTLNFGVQGSGGADVTIWGASANDQLTSGCALAAGDVDGDGVNDIVLGAVGGDGPAEGRNGAGEAYVVRGRTTFPATLDLAISGSTGADLTIYGATASDNLTSGGGLALGDINRDGITDLLLGAPLADGPSETRSSAGEAYIVFGGPLSSATRDLAIEGSGGADVTVYGATAGDNLCIGRTLALADVNGNGFADLVLGAPLADGPAETRVSAGEVYIVRGRPVYPAVLDLALPGNVGASVTIYGATANDQISSGGALAVADVNGDGVADMLIGISNGDGPAEGRFNAGEVAVLYGVGAPEIDLAQPLQNEIANGGSKSFGQVGVEGTKRLLFTIKNTGAADVTGLELTMDGTDAEMFAITSIPVAPVAPGGSTTFTVAFAPVSFGMKTATIGITSNDDDESPYEITLTGIGVPPVPPLVETLPANPVSSFGATLNAAVNAVGCEREVIFDYGTTPGYGMTVAAAPFTIDGETVVTVQAALANLLPRTIYHFRVRASGDLGAAAGEDMTFETVNRAPIAVPDHAVVLPGAIMTIDVLANDTDPDGDVLQLTSFKKPLPASCGKVEQVGNALEFTASNEFAGATFTYTIADGYGGTATGMVTLTLGSCSLDPAVVSVPAAGATYGINVTATGAWSVDERLSWVTVASASGIDDGVVLVTVLPHTANNTRTRTLTIGGQTHTITQTSLKALGATSNSAAELNSSTEALPAELTGTYHGLVDRHPALNGNLGSRLELVTTSTGYFTGKLITGSTSQPLTGMLTADDSLVFWRAAVAVSGTTQTLELEIGVDDAANVIAGKLTDGGLNEASVNGWRNAWDAETNPASAYAASYAFSLEQPNPDPALPQGNGRGAFTVGEATGALVAAGRLSDNSVFTSSTFVGPQGQVLLYQFLDVSNGSLAGKLVVTPGASVEANTIGGEPSWHVPAVPAKTKKDISSPGFGPIPLTAGGGAQSANPGL